MNLQIIRRISGIVHKMIFLQKANRLLHDRIRIPVLEKGGGISPSVRSCTFKDSAPAHVPGGLKDPKAPLRSFFQNRALTDTVFSLIPHYIKKGKVLIRENFALSLIQDSTRSIRIYSPFHSYSSHAASLTFPVTVHTYVPCNRILLYFSSSASTPTGGSSVGASFDASGIIVSSESPYLTRTLFSISRQISGFAARKFFAFSRPRPILLPLISIPGAALLHDVLLRRQIQYIALTGNTFSEHDIKLCLTEWRSNLVLHNLDADTVSNHFAALLRRLNPADIHADRRIELECPSTGRNLRVSEHDTNLLTQLVDKDNDTI